MLRARSIALLLALLVPVAACGGDDDDSDADPLDQLVGTWTTQSFTYTADADPSTALDIFALAGLGIQTITVNADGSFSGSLILPDEQGQPQQIPLTGTLDNVTQGTLTINFTGAAAQALSDLDASFDVSNDILTLVATDVSFDFTLQGNAPIPADLTIVLVRT